MKKKIYVSGHNGMVGSAIVRILGKNKNCKLILRNKSELDLLNQQDVINFFKKEKPDEVYIAAAKVGGINYNFLNPAEFIYENIMIQSNLIHASYKHNVKKLMFLGSSCIYPKFSKQPMREDYLLSGSLEPTNEAYAIAKISGLKMCQYYNKQYNVDFRCIMPTNLYGPGDKYHLDHSHVIPALIYKFHLAKTNGDKNVIIWGSGKAKREFLFVDDLAEASVYLMQLKKTDYLKNLKNSFFLNVGTGVDISIKNLAYKIKNIINFKGKIIFDKTRPDGMMQKLLDVKKIKKYGCETYNITL